MIRPRLIYSAVALTPGLMLLALPEATRIALAELVGPAGLIGCAVLVAALVVHGNGWRFAPSRTETRRSQRNADLTLPDLHRAPPADFPDIDTQRAQITARLARLTCPDEKIYGPAEPDRVDFAIARIIGHVTDLWQVPTAAALSDAQVRELYTIDRLATATPAEAGALAQRFRNPALAIDIRDQVAALAAQRAAFDRARAAYEATLKLRDADHGPGDILQAVTSLSAPDAELWHHVVARHDPAHERQREAALWCVSQSGCQRATVALWFARLVEEGPLQERALKRDVVFLHAVREILARWIAGVYTRDEIGLDPETRLLDLAGPAAQTLERVSAITATPRLDVPQDLFGPHPGRAPRPRPAWDLVTGALVGTPNPADYFDPS